MSFYEMDQPMDQQQMISTQINQQQMLQQNEGQFLII